MQSVSRLLVFVICIAGCPVDDPIGPFPSSGSGLASSSGVATNGATSEESGDTDTGDLDTDAGLDLAGCDLLADPVDACGPGMACDSETLTCVPASGVAVVDEACLDDSECSPALVCFDGRCRELCGPDIPGEDGCDGGRVCTQAQSPLPGLCLEPCSLLLQACSVGSDACNLGVGSAGKLIAVCTANPGAGVTGDACESDGDCLAGQLCTPASVHQLPCAGGAASCCAPICDTFDLPCVGVEPVCNLLGIEDQPNAGFCGN